MTSVRSDLREALKGYYREADDDDHYYGPWHGGPKAMGGYPGRLSRKDPDDGDTRWMAQQGRGDWGVIDKDPYPVNAMSEMTGSIDFDGDASVNARGTTFDDRIGNCYEYAAGYLIVDGKKGPDMNLVHGSIRGFGNPRIKHAWVEVLDGDGNISAVYEPGSNHLWSPPMFGQFFNAHVDARYPKDKAYVNLIKTEHYGPWHL